MRISTPFFAVTFLLCTALCGQTPLALLKDINNEPGAGGTFPEEIVQAGPFIYFSGETLHRTDGTPEGTSVVKNVLNSDGPFQPQSLTAVNSKIFFTAINRNGNELWVSDGTADGTYLVKDIYPNNTSTFVFNLKASNGFIYFVAFEPSSGYELWRSDGSSIGTSLVKDISPSTDENFLTAPSELTDFRDTLFFSAFDGSARKIFRTDGTAGGTSLVKDIDAENLTVVGEKLFFAGYIPTRGYALYKTNGTEAGTVIVKDDWPGTVSGDFTNFTVKGDTLYFTVNNQLWKSDGTTDGTVMVKDAFTTIESLALTSDHIYFIAETEENGREIWRTNGTPGGTKLFYETSPDADSRYVEDLTVVDDSVYFRVDGSELWRLNGSQAVQILGDGILNAHNLTAIDNTLYFVASKSGTVMFSDNDELWRSDGTEAGTYMLSGLDEMSGDALPSSFTQTDNLLYFVATDQSLLLPKVWRTDGTGAGTISLGETAGTQIVRAGSGNDVYFLKYDETLGSELFKSDGTVAGTSLVKDVHAGAGDTDLRGGLSVNMITYLQLNDGANGLELWKSDGTEGGTTLVKDITPGPEVTAFGEMIEFQGALYFVANNGENGTELWTSNGSEAGTFLVKDILEGAAGSNPQNLTVMNNTLYFFTNDGITENALWRSDGTAGGTVLVKDFTGGILANTLVSFENNLYFFASDGTDGGLWRSDGSAPNTTLVKAFEVDRENTSLAVANGLLFFNASDGVVGNELWSSDGTPGGTTLVEDIYIGALSSSIKNFVTYNNALYFLAQDPFTGYELWKTDGVDCGAIRITENDVLLPTSIHRTNTTLIVPAKGGYEGYELYTYNTANDPIVAGKSDQTITFVDITNKTYGDVFTLEAMSDAGLPVSYKILNPSQAQVEGTTLTLTGTGYVEVIAYQPGDDSHCPADPVVETFYADKAILHVQAYDATRVYGDSNPPLKFFFFDFKNGDDSLVVDRLPAVSTTATTGSDVGSYPIFVVDGHDDHYILAYGDATLDITKAPLTATADNQTITYRDDIPVLTVTFAGFRNGDDEGDVVPPGLSTDADASSDAGEYTIYIFGGEAANYELQLVSGILTIQKAIADIIITNLNQEADGSPKTVMVETDPENLNHIVTYSGSATPPTEAGTYDVVVMIDETNYQGEATAQLVVEEIVGVEQEQAVALDVYSNPVNERLIVAFKRDYVNATQLAVFSMQGQQLYVKSIPKASMGDQEYIPLKDWMPGIYHLVATDAQGKRSGYRIIKQ